MKRLELSKILASSLLITSVFALYPIKVTAEWRQDSKGWWNTEGDSYSVGWKQIDGKWYYFNQNGYMEQNAQVDKYILGADGAWNGKIADNNDEKIKSDKQNPNMGNGDLEYSNLLDEATNKEIKSRMIRNGLSEKNVNTVFNWTADYNEYMGDLEELNFKDGFNKMREDKLNYWKYYSLMKKWYSKRKYDDFLCRSSAFELLKDKINASNIINEKNWDISEDGCLSDDKKIFDSNPLADLTNKEKDVFFTLFNPVSIKANSSTDDIYKAVINEWKKRGVSFANGSVYLITRWDLSKDGKFPVSVGHAGVLIEDSDGLLFFEKTNPLSPYQAIKFNTKEQVKNYMINALKTQIDIEQYDLQMPTMVVLMNDKLM